MPYAPVEVSLSQLIQGHEEAPPSRPYHPQNPPLLVDGTVERIPQITEGKLSNLSKLQSLYL